MTSNLQFNYSQKQLRYSLGFGILWLIIFIAYLIFRSESYLSYGYLVIGVLFIGSYFYKKIFHYAVIKDGVLIKNDVLKKRIKLDEITDVHYFSGKYRLLAPHSEMIINTMVLDKTAIEDLKKVIKQINLPKS